MGIVNRCGPLRTDRHVSALLGAIALTAVAGCQNSQPVPARPIAKPVATPIGKPAAPQAKAPLPDKQGQEALDASAVRSRLVVVKAGKDNGARQVVILGRPAGMQDIPVYKQPTRPDMLPREMVRQAVLVAARDELGLATRDQVIDETPADTKEAGKGIVEVVSFIRDNRSHEIVRRLEKEQTETIISHETPTAPGPHLDLIKLLASAEALSRQEFPSVLKGLGLVGKPNSVKDDAGLPEKVDDRLASLDFLDALLAVRDVHKAIRTDGESPSRLGALRAATRSWEFSANSTGTLHIKRSKLGRSSTLSDWSHEIPIGPGVSGTVLSPWRSSAGIAMRWPTLMRRKKRQRPRARRWSRTGSRLSMPTAVLSRRDWDARRDLKRSLRHCCACSPWRFPGRLLPGSTQPTMS